MFHHTKVVVAMLDESLQSQGVWIQLKFGNILLPLF